METDIAENILAKKAGEAMQERSRWIDSTIANALPKWKLKLLKKYPYPIVARLLFIVIKITNKMLVANFGTQITIKLNGKVIGRRDFK